MTYFLASVNAYTAVRPCFGIALFSKHQSNRTFAQDLDISGNVRRFLDFDTANFSDAGIIAPPPFSLELGDKGIFVILGTFQIDFLGNIDDLKDHFEEFQYVGTTLEIEAANLLGSYERLKNGLSELGWLSEPRDALKAWREAELSTFKALSKLRKQQADDRETDYSALEKEFSFLTTDPESPEWAKTWLRLWQQSYKRQKLIRIACWRADSGYRPQPDGGAVYRLSLDYANDPNYVAKHCLLWLRLADYWSTDWLALATSLFGFKGFREKLVDVALKKLSANLDEKSFHASAWRRLWQFCWTRLTNESTLLQYAEMYFDRVERISVRDGELLRNVLRSKGSISVFFRHISSWLIAYPRNSLTWADLYISAYQFRQTEELFKIGLHWLQEYGGTTNRWSVICKLLQSNISVENRTKMALNWLRRARWDLRSWPSVFCSSALAVRDVSVAQAFLSVGRSWMDQRPPWQRDRADVMKVCVHLTQNFGVADSENDLEDSRERK